MTGHPGPDQASDAALVDAYRAGSQAAASELVTRHARAMGRFLYSAGASQSDVEDLAQEAFFRAFRRLDSWRGDASFRSWLFSIARNLLRDEFRKRRGRQVLSLEDRDLPNQHDPAGEVEALEAVERMRRGLKDLPRLQREVFLLRVQEGASYDEIAAALDTTPGAARVHYHHAVKRLKELLV
jgi:RNA polymerase sigma-70 factor (ECF subfamily)